jgi:hypothetical protein
MTTNIEQLRKRLEKIELVNHPNERLSEEFIRGAVNRTLEKIGNEVTITGIPFWDATTAEQKAHNKKWLDEHPEGLDDGINVEREARKLAHLLPLVRGL